MDSLMKIVGKIAAKLISANVINHRRLVPSKGWKFDLRCRREMVLSEG